MFHKSELPARHSSVSQLSPRKFIKLLIHVTIFYQGPEKSFLSAKTQFKIGRVNASLAELINVDGSLMATS